MVVVVPPPPGAAVVVVVLKGGIVVVLVLVLALVLVVVVVVGHGSHGSVLPSQGFEAVQQAESTFCIIKADILRRFY
tara:strand:+ start:537 stop:767 length:231 start_codon:yes stop_codon:yes gene_type:complete